MADIIVLAALNTTMSLMDETEDSLYRVWGLRCPKEPSSTFFGKGTGKNHYQLESMEAKFASIFKSTLYQESNRDFAAEIESLAKEYPVVEIFPELREQFSSDVGFTYFIAACLEIKRGEINSKLNPLHRAISGSQKWPSPSVRFAKKDIYHFFEWESSPVSPKVFAKYLCEKNDWSEIASHQVLFVARELEWITWTDEGIFPHNMTGIAAVAHVLTFYPEGATFEETCHRVNAMPGLCRSKMTLTGVKRASSKKTTTPVVGLRKRLLKHQRFFDIPEEEARQILNRLATYFRKKNRPKGLLLNIYWNKNEQIDYGSFLRAVEKWGEQYGLQIEANSRYYKTRQRLVEIDRSHAKSPEKNHTLLNLEILGRYQEPVTIPPILIQITGQKLLPAAVLNELIQHQVSQNEFFVLSQEDMVKLSRYTTIDTVLNVLNELHSLTLVTVKRTEHQDRQLQCRVNMEKIGAAITAELAKEKEHKES